MDDAMKVNECVRILNTTTNLQEIRIMVWNLRLMAGHSTLKRLLEQHKLTPFAIVKVLRETDDDLLVHRCATLISLLTSNGTNKDMQSKFSEAGVFLPLLNALKRELPSVILTALDDLTKENKEVIRTLRDVLKSEEILRDLLDKCVWWKKDHLQSLIHRVCGGHLTKAARV